MESFLSILKGPTENNKLYPPKYTCLCSFFLVGTVIKTFFDVSISDLSLMIFNLILKFYILSKRLD